MGIPDQGRVIQLKDCGPVRVFRTVRKEDGQFQHLATDDLKIDVKKRDELESMGWGIEVYHTTIKSAAG